MSKIFQDEEAVSTVFAVIVFSAIGFVFTFLLSLIPPVILGLIIGAVGVLLVGLFLGKMLFPRIVEMSVALFSLLGFILVFWRKTQASLEICVLVGLMTAVLCATGFFYTTEPRKNPEKWPNTD